MTDSHRSSGAVNLLLVLTRQVRAIVKLQLEAVTAGYKARECGIVYARPIPGNRLGLQNKSQCSTNNTRVRNDQNMPALVALKKKLECLCNTRTKCFQRFGTVRPVTLWILVEGLIFIFITRNDLIRAQAFPATQSDFTKARINLDWKTVPFLQYFCEGMTTLHG